MLGETLGPYTIDRELGSGGMGKVYAATVADRAPGLSAGDCVALKVVHPHLLETPGFFMRFMREAQLGASIQHENVVRTLMADASSTHHFLVMEYVEGQTLAELARELERVPEELCRHVGREICKGLAAIHAAGVVHRDMKPDNVLITADHVVKVMDLGVARLADEQMRLSQSGAFVGSVEYAAPEQFKGGDVDGRTDLHALGLVLYELASGSHPYRGGSFHEVLSRVCDTEPRRLGDVNPQLSAFFEEVVHTLLVKDPRGRFASAAQLLDVLVEGEDSAWWHERARQLQSTTQRPIRRARIPRETAVYGREPELATLRSLFDRAAAGDGQVVLLEGEAGIGKSRLVDELTARLHAAGTDFHFLFGGYPPGGAATVDGGFSSAFREHFGEAGSAAYLPENQILVPAFDALLRGESASDGAHALTPGSLQTCFVRATQSLAAERVAVVLIDDLHFAPEEGRALFSSLAMAVPGHRVLLIGATRPGVSEEWRAGLTRVDQTTQMPVHRLGPKDLVALLGDSLGSSHLAEELAGKIAVKSDGNPFFAFEIIRGLREGQFITRRDDGTWASTRVIDEIEIPSSVLDLVNARVADLSEEQRDLLDVASCCGYEFDPALVADVVGAALLPTLKRFATIEKRHRLVRASGRRLVFDHHQVQEALYGSLYEQMREAYHAGIAAALEARTNAADRDPESLGGALCVELCEHYLKGARGAAALRYLPAAQDHLTNGYLQAEMVALTDRALAIPDLLTGADRAQSLLRLAGTFDMLGRRARQEECVREAAHLAEAEDDDELRVSAASALGRLLRLTSRYVEAEAACRRALKLGVARGDLAGEARARGNLGTVFFSQGRLVEALEQHGRTLELSRATGDRKVEASALMNVGLVVKGQGRLADAQRYSEESLAINREIADREGEANGMNNLGTVFQAAGRLAEAREQYERSLAVCCEIGDRDGEMGATANLGNVHFFCGHLARAREGFERGLALARETGSRIGETIVLHNLGVAHWEAGAIAPAKEHLLECLPVSDDIGMQQVSAMTHLVLGRIHSAAGDEDAARESFSAARDVAVAGGVHGIETVARCELACLSNGDATDALAVFAANGERLEAEELLASRFLLWGATGDRAHLAEAKRLLDESVADVDVETRASMLTNLRLNREVLAAWRAEFGEAGDDAPADASSDSDDDEPPRTESMTRIG